jgi:uncharacterized protein (DUF1015 family)
MADIQAFRAFRYDLGRCGTLADVVAPPYDVIGPEFQQKLEARSPHNIVHVDLGRDEPGDDANRNRYTRSSTMLRDWIQMGVIQQDTGRGLYVYHQEYQFDRGTRVRRGFFARVRLQPFGTGQIFPHEQTFAGPKEDRLKLMRATGMNLSPVFGMYPDAAGEVQARLDEAVRRTLPLEATDHLGTISRLWPVTDQKLVSEVTGLMGPKPIYIADGHHRYETSLKYLAERRAAGEVVNDDAAPNFTLMMLVGMSDPGLQVMPTHRLLSGLSALSGDEVVKMFGSHFAIEPAASAADAWQTIEADDSKSILGFGTASDGRWLVARFVRPEAMHELAPDQSPEWRSLAVSILHRLVIDKLLVEQFGGRPDCEYVHLVEEAAAALAAKNCDLALLVPPVTVAEIQTLAAHGETTPQKATYFYPKVLTGLLMNSLKGH